MNAISVTEKRELSPLERASQKVVKAKKEKAAKKPKVKDIYGFTVGTKKSETLRILAAGGTMKDVINELGDAGYSYLMIVRKSGKFSVEEHADKTYVITPIEPEAVVEAREAEIEA
jgi:hypothetical protein